MDKIEPVSRAKALIPDDVILTRSGSLGTCYRVLYDATSREGRYDETGQHLGSFAKLLQKRGICAQYTMFGTPQQNGVSERRN